MRSKLNENTFLIYILCGEFDKYGRLLGWLFDSNEDNYPDSNDILIKSYNHQLIKAGLAYFYGGKLTKFTEQEQIEYLNSQNKSL